MSKHKSHHGHHGHSRSQEHNYGGIPTGPIVGIAIAVLIFVIVFLLALFKCRSKRRRFGSKVPSYHPVALQEAQAKRKERKTVDDIHRLRRELAAKETELQEQHQRSTQLTARTKKRAESDTQKEREWQQIMARGKELYGEDWHQPSQETGGVPLSTLFAMHKDELMTYRQETEENLPPWQRTKPWEQQNLPLARKKSSDKDSSSRRRRRRDQPVAQAPQQPQQQSQVTASAQDRTMLARFESPRQAPPSLPVPLSQPGRHLLPKANSMGIHSAGFAKPPLAPAASALDFLQRAQMAGMDPQLRQMGTGAGAAAIAGGHIRYQGQQQPPLPSVVATAAPSAGGLGLASRLPPLSARAYA